MADSSRSHFPSPAISDMPLEDKEVFYGQLGNLEAVEDEDDEVLDESRQQIRALLARAKSGNIKRPLQSNVASSAPKPASKRLNTTSTSSTPASRVHSARATPAAGTTPTIIDATPSLAEQSKQVNPRQLQTSKSFVDNTPQGLHSAAIAPLRRTQTTPGAISSANSFPSSTRQHQASAMTKTNRGKSVDKGKTKGREAIPESDQKMKGLRLFYIPGDRIKLRKDRMERAELYGAVVTSNLSEATHVVVDKHLTYEDIKSHIPSVTGKKPIIVTDQWPLECILRKVVFPPTRRYRPKGTPDGETTPAVQKPDATADIPNASLELKSPTNKRSRWDYVSTETTQTTQSSDRVVDSFQEFSEPSEQRDRQVGAAISSTSHPPSGTDDTKDEPPQQSKPCISGSDFGDELAEIMNQAREDFKDLPRISEDDANTQGEGSKESSGDSESGNDSDSGRKQKRQKKKSFEEYFACSRGGTKDGAEGEDNPNAETITVLKKMCDYYAKTNDHWRATSYRKAIKVLERTTERKVSTAEEALELPCFGPRLSAKLEEIVNTHSLARLEYANSDPLSKTLSLFLKIYGVGKTTADKWINQGCKSLDDLVTNVKLTESQRLGIDHFDDLNSRIPRAEVTQLGDYVKAEAAQIDSSVFLLVGGSYRRGADSSGDIDFIITKKGTTSSKDLLPFLNKLVGNLWQQKFLTAELASHSSTKDDGGSKWHGCCVLPRILGFNDDESYRSTWRRIDLLLVPESEYGAALIYFTGNDIFNRSIRLLASRKGMRLNQRGLYKDVMRGADRMKVTEGELIEGRDEKKIFEILKVKWREPHERWC